MDTQAERRNNAKLRSGARAAALYSHAADSSQLASELSRVAILAESDQNWGGFVTPSDHTIAEDIAAVTAIVRPQDARLFGWLLGALGWVESHWGRALETSGTNKRGDKLGELQISSNTNPELTSRKLPDGSPAWQDRRANILMGAEILNACLNAFPNNVKAAVAAYDAGISAVRNELAKGNDPDNATRGSEYPGYYARNVLDTISNWGGADALRPGSGGGGSTSSSSSASASSSSPDYMLWVLVAIALLGLVLASRKPKPAN